MKVFLKFFTGNFQKGRKSDIKVRAHDNLVISDVERRAIRLSSKFKRTGHGPERALLLMKLAKIAASNGTDIIEIGVFRGGSAQLIINSLDEVKSSINLTLVDTFTGHPSSSVNSDLDGAQRVGHFKSTNFDEVSMFVHKVNKNPNINIRVLAADAMSVEISKLVANHSVGLCHIDTDLFAPTYRVLCEVSPYIAPGGFFLIDDYRGGRTPGLVKAVEDFLRENLDFTFVPTIVTQAILVKNN